MEERTDRDLWSLLVGESPAPYLSRFTLKELHRLGDAELKGIPGVDSGIFDTVRAFLELSRRLTSRPLKPGAPFLSSDDVFKAFNARLRLENQEHFYALLLDSKNHLIKEVLVSLGSLTASIVHPRELYSRAVREAAAGVICIHNHPSGSPDPSHEDNALTERIKDAGQLIGIKVLDHVIIGHDTYYSFADQGLI